MGQIMIPETIKNKLDNLIGNSWMYNGRNIRVKGVNQINGEIRVITEGHPIVFSVDKAEPKIEEFLPVDAGPEAIRNPEARELAMQVFSKDKGQMDSLEEIILENIKNVKKDPKFVGQAKVVNSNVQTLLNINKQKIEMIKEIRKHG